MMRMAAVDVVEVVAQRRLGDAGTGMTMRIGSRAAYGGNAGARLHRRPNVRVTNVQTAMPARSSLSVLRMYVRIKANGAAIIPRMPELPDVTVYVEAIAKRIVGQPLLKLRLGNPFVLRTVDPPPSDARRQTRHQRPPPRQAHRDRARRRSLHRHPSDDRRPLQVAAAGAKIPGKLGLAAFDFPNGTLLLTEAGSKRRASIHIVRGEEAVRAHDPGGIEPLDITLDEFRAALTRERHTLKRTLTDPHVFSGIGNAYSDEILHRARLSPVQMTTNLSDDEIARLYDATRDTLIEWTDRLRAEAGDKFPEKVTAFRPDMAVHGRYGKPCPDCGTPVQHIVYSENETNYCARCQTGGKLLADRALSRLLHSDWPKSIDEL